MAAGARRTFGVMLLVFAVAANGCGESIVYRDVPAFSDPPAGAGNFLGYSDATAKRTTCGNCHVGKQGLWQQTKHASAWTTLAASTSKAVTCEGCHTVNHRGNVSTDSVGWQTTRDPRYQDVQCESCHGPGLTHVTNPDVANTKPLASLQVSATLTKGCGECHSGSHRPFVEEWAASRHARVSVSRATNPSCIGCHEAKGVLEAWGVRSTFATEPAGEHMAITCAVCHDPHDKRNPRQLRYPIDVPSLETNLCMKCHYRRAAPEVASASGPHSPQGPVLLGEAGWTPPNFTYPPKSLVGSHGTDRNPRMCATCHVNDYTLTDPKTKSFTFRATGHSFQPIPCVDANGVPTGSTTCTDDQRSFRACTSCHLTEGAARTALTVARLRLTTLATQISTMLPKIPSTEFSTTDGRISTGEGARFNMQLANEKGSPAHNPFLIEALLIASINQIKTDYGVQPAVVLDLRPQLAPR